MDLEGWFESLGLAEIEEFVTNGEQEDLHLDFKTANSFDLSDSKDRKHYARALSGFANTSGGIILWGVYAAPNEDKVDCAQELRPIERVSLFHSRLESLTGAWIDPQITGVRHQAIPIEETNDKGYAVSYIPESESGPHMVTLNKEYRYYMRVGESFERMPHSHVADRFFRKRRPKLDLYTEITGAQLVKVHADEFVQFHIIIGIVNYGKATAKYPYLSIKINEPYSNEPYALGDSVRDGLRKLHRGHPGDPHRYAADANDVVHPESCVKVARLTGKISDFSAGKAKDVIIDYEIMAEDADRVSKQKVITVSEILAVARRA